MTPQLRAFSDVPHWSSWRARNNAPCRFRAAVMLPFPAGPVARIIRFARGTERWSLALADPVVAGAGVRIWCRDQRQAAGRVADLDRGAGVGRVSRRSWCFAGSRVHHLYGEPARRGPVAGREPAESHRLRYQNLGECRGRQRLTPTPTGPARSAGPRCTRISAWSTTPATCADWAGPAKTSAGAAATR
jgi:hypothetical protein